MPTDTESNSNCNGMQRSVYTIPASVASMNRASLHIRSLTLELQRKSLHNDVLVSIVWRGFKNTCNKSRLDGCPLSLREVEGAVGCATFATKVYDVLLALIMLT